VAAKIDPPSKLKIRGLNQRFIKCFQIESFEKKKRSMVTPNQLTKRLQTRAFINKGVTMLKLDDIMDIKILHKEGYSIKEIVRKTGRSRNTVRKVLRGGYNENKKRKQRETVLDPYKSILEETYYKEEVSGTRLYEKIKLMGYTGSIDQVYRYIRPLKKRIKAAEKATVRFETAPGKQAQVDWGHCGQFMDENGKKQNLYVFAIILSYSRDLYIEFTTSMKLKNLIECHKNAFNYFGGIPQTILYDNMKQVRVDADNWNTQFVDFAQYYGFELRRCRPYRARTKGKIERSIRYVKDNFLKGRVFASLDELNTASVNWLDTKANVRNHATTEQRPCDLLKEELEYLQPVNTIRPYIFTEKAGRKVTSEGYVNFNASRYSVPPENVGKQVYVEQNGQKIYIRSKDMIIAEHSVAEKEGMAISDREHVSAMWKLTVSQSKAPAKDCHIQFNQNVQTCNLNVFDEVM